MTQVLPKQAIRIILPRLKWCSKIQIDSKKMIRVSKVNFRSRNWENPISKCPRTILSVSVICRFKLIFSRFTSAWIVVTTIYSTRVDILAFLEQQLFAYPARLGENPRWCWNVATGQHEQDIRYLYRWSESWIQSFFKHEKLRGGESLWFKRSPESITNRGNYLYKATNPTCPWVWKREWSPSTVPTKSHQLINSWSWDTTLPTIDRCTICQ